MGGPSSIRRITDRVDQNIGQMPPSAVPAPRGDCADASSVIRSAVAPVPALL